VLGSIDGTGIFTTGRGQMPMDALPIFHNRRGDRQRWERSVPAGARRGPDRAQADGTTLIMFHLVG